MPDDTANAPTAGMPINELARIAEVSIRAVQNAIQRGDLATVPYDVTRITDITAQRFISGSRAARDRQAGWRDRRLFIARETGTQWAEKYRPVAPIRKQTSLPEIADPYPPGMSRSGSRKPAGKVTNLEFEIHTLIKRRVPKPQPLNLEPFIKAALEGERIWTVVEIAAAANTSRGNIINAIRNQSLIPTDQPAHLPAPPRDAPFCYRHDNSHMSKFCIIL
jgi:hypothetical protein